MDAPSDVFSLSDHLLAERLQFVKEIGFGNWGSVWLCRPKSSSGKVKDLDVAVKLVHRSKTSTTAARVRSLWNEMKIVRSFKHDPHPSIVPFHSFIITPSYALITMTHLPTPVPVEVSEPRAKEWFNSLLSGVHFLHSRGVVHNDIKPANILLSRTNTPVLVDFGFAEKYDLHTPKAFYSNLTYGTPEYLSPERARGLPHDTRKSDVWSLGVTFFEILVGRTPFEYEEGEVFENKEDLERYWRRTMRGKWVGKYSISRPVEHFLKRMIVPNADLRCTATEIMGDPYWHAISATPIHNHRKATSAATPSSVPARTRILLDSSRNEKDRENELSSRLFGVSLPWSASESRSSASRPESRTGSISRSVSRTGVSSRPASRAESASRTASATSSPSQSHTLPSEAPMLLNPQPVTGQAPPTSVALAERSATHARSRSQPKLCTPPDISTVARARKLSTVQASPLIRPRHQFSMETDFEVATNASTRLRRPVGPRQPSPRITSVSNTLKESPVSSEQVETSQKKHTPSHLVHPRALEADRIPMRPRAAPHMPTPSNISQTPLLTVTRTPLRTPKTSQQISSSKQLSGRPPRTRRRAAVLVDLTGFARNVDLGAHGVGRPARHGEQKKDRRKENARGRTAMQKENKAPPSQVYASRKDVHAPNNSSEAIVLRPKTPVKDQDVCMSIPLAPNLSTATAVAKGSVRDRMMDWERERERLREMVRMADNASTILTRTSTESSDDDSSVEAEVAAELASAQAKTPVGDESHEEANVNVEARRPTISLTTVSSSSSKLERSQIEVAKIGVRTSAQILSSHNGSITALGATQSAEKQLSEDIRIQNSSVTDIGLPKEVNRNLNGESGFSSLKHSVKASIDKGVRIYKSSTLGQLTGRTTPVWATSSEPLDFEQRRSGEEGRFSWENIRPEREVAVDRMNEWIQSVEKVVQETRQNFASTSVTPPAALPLASVSRSSASYHGALNIPATMTQSNNTHNNNVVNASRSSRLPRRLLAANEIFAEPGDSNTSLSPAPSRGGVSNTSSSNNYAPESSLPVLSSITTLMQTPRRRRAATILTRSPAQSGAGSTTNDIFDGSPSKRREKSKSQSNLDRHIKDVAKLELELSMAPVASPSPRLSAVFDKSLFVAPPLSPRLTEDSSTTLRTTCGRSTLIDDLNSSSYHVEPYPPCESGRQIILGTPDKRHSEGVYDRFLMAATGVKRAGKGYQSENLKPMHNIMSTTEHAKAGHARGFGVFGAGKRAIPPPVSSEDAWRRSTSTNELGFITAGQRTNTSSSRTCKDESRSTFVRRAIKAMVPGKTTSRRLSRTIVV